MSVTLSEPRICDIDEISAVMSNSALPRISLPHQIHPLGAV